MKTSMLLSAESTPTRFISVKGLSSPFRDQPVTSLTVSSHVIDISPTPPPPASILGTLSGRFEDPLSPDVKTPTEADFIPLLEIEEFSSTEPTTLNARHQPIGLGLGIDTGESAFANFLPMATEEVFNSPPALPWGMEGSALSSGPLAILSTRRVQSSPWPASFENVTPERSQDQDLWTHRVSNDGELEIADLEPAHQSFSTPLKETSPVTPSEISPSLPANSPSSVLSTTPQTENLENVNVPSISQRLTRRLLSFNRKSLVDDKLPLASVAPELQAIPINVISPPRETSDMPLPLSMKFSPRGRLLSTLRHRMRLRGIDYLESDQVDRTSPVLTSKSGSDAGSFTGSPSDGIISSSFGKNDSPLELPSSPAFPSRSPNLRDTPGSFSPLMHDHMAFSPAITQAAQAMPAPPGTSTLVLSILVGSLGFVGVCLVLAVMAWKKNGGFPGFSSWKRKHRGTAYDEFMEEKSCWVADKKLRIHRESKPNPERTATTVNQNPAGSLSGHEDGKSMVSRSTSQAPSIPPLAYLVNGKLSIDSIRLEFPAPVSSPTTPSFISGLSSNYEEDAKDNDYKIISTLKNRSQPDIDQSSHRFDFSNDANLSSRARSDSKSSTISKASIKSINSIASFLLNITKFDSLSAGNKKAKLEMGISSENYKNLRDSLNSVNDPFGKSSPDLTKQGSIPVFNQPIKQVESTEGLVRAASAQINRSNYSESSQDAPKRPNTISCVPPAILITDHPSELIPPSPPRSSTYDQRPESIGTFLARYSNFNSTPELEFHSEGSSSPTSPQHEYPMPHSYQNHHDNQSVAEASEPRAERYSSDRNRAERQPTPRMRTTTSGQEWRVKDPRINSISGLISHRSRTSELLAASPLQDFDRTNAKFDFAPKRTSLNTLNSSQTIRELAAVTEDLRALIDSEMDADCSWESPSQFHQTVPDWVTLPPNFMVAPPMRPPKSASRYSSMKPTSIEYESTSTPCSPHDSMPLSMPLSSEHFLNNGRAPTRSSRVPPPFQSHDVHFEPSSSTKSKRFSTGSRVKKSASESSIETVVSADSNASILEIASLHTAQTRSVRGVSAEFVIRQSIAQIQALDTHNRMRMTLNARPE
ncbi:hypothetical protein Pst134EA_001113 [Puccinia striiformis f. sp. tritici]|uniref:hypothetical protein n=1 Tax=Puccinia striiformis f. sp. tritici TaxID=168172 RepID=UPI0020077514|nr:hypothetical protein Pst134EA_001113 [Puccinia striiformis f. sp. tritici]KAH9474062.1 hypothetical protein Pst134EA_001113 [Puccinia striiformis f. sp. tritici]